jgi:hypothetical protein
MTFTLSGRNLTATIGANTPAATKAKLNGKTIAFSCAHMQGRITGTHTLKLWPAGAQTVRATLPKKLANPDACGVETRSGRDISFAYFD